MITVDLGKNSRNNDFDITTIDFVAFGDRYSDYEIGIGTLKVLQNDNNYTVLYGDFSYATPNDYSTVIQELDSVKLVEKGEVSFVISGLDIRNGDVVDEFVFEQYLLTKAYALNGNQHDNHLVSYLGNDILNGSGGNDILEGLGGADQLDGGTGVDKLDGGLGDDRLTGGTGKDYFLVADDSGADTITDFKAFGRGRDRIDLTNHSTIDSFDDLSITQDGSDVVIDLGGDTIILENVSLAKIDVTDFLF